MPVRKIPKNYRSVTGRFPSLKNGRSIAFESTLERDFFLSLEFDDSVASYEEQPITISGKSDGHNINYTPDCLVQHVDGKETLYEVKYTTDLEKNAEELTPRFTIAERYVNERGMAFRVVTELDIRGPKLDNQRFIYGYAAPPKDTDVLKEEIFDHLTNPLSLNTLLANLSTDRILQAVYLPVVWHLVFVGTLQVDMGTPITNKTIIQVNYGANIS